MAVLWGPDENEQEAPDDLSFAIGLRNGLLISAVIWALVIWSLL